MKILIISPAFPPFAGVGGMRMASLSKYLNKSGVEVIVLRNEPSYWGESTIKANIPSDIEIIDVPAKDSFIKNAAIYYHSIVQVITDQKIDIVLYSVGPFFTLLAALFVKIRIKHKFIIDFRDLWSYEKRINVGWKSKLRFFKLQSLYKFVERPAVLLANKIVVVTPGDLSIMKKKYKIINNRFHVILNGYEESDVSEIDETANKDESLHIDNEFIKLVALGKFRYYAPQLAQLVFSASSELNDEGYNIKIIHIGEKEINMQLAGEESNESIYVSKGYLNYSEAVDILSKSDIGIIVYNHPTGYGTKVFDYIAANKPIILITEKAVALSNLVSQFKCGYVCDSKDSLKSIIKEISNSNYKYLDEDINIIKYSRNNQNENYLNLLISALISKE